MKNILPNIIYLLNIKIPGLDDWSDTDVLTQVLAASQQEYLDSLKQAKEHEQQNPSSNSRRSSSDSNQDKK